MKPPYYHEVGSIYGAPMGRRSNNIPEGTKVYLRSVPIVDGYDPGGAYWGMPSNLYCAWAEVDGEFFVKYFRAKDRSAAKESLAGLKFFS